MKRHPLSPETRAWLGFAATVALAFLAALAGWVPEWTTPSEDSPAQLISPARNLMH